MVLLLIKYKYFLLAITNCGIMTKNIAKNYYYLHHNTINELVKNNTLDIKGNLILFGKVSTIYVLSKKSKNNVRKSGKSPYKTNTSQLEHDYLLLKSYCSLPLQYQITWKNETELKETYRNSTTIDGMFLMADKKIGVEIFTSNYSNEIIKKKLEFGSLNCDKLITMNTEDIKYK